MDPKTGVREFWETHGISSGAGSLTRATEAPRRGVLGRHVAGHALRVCTPVREYYLIGPEHTGNAQQ